MMRRRIEKSLAALSMAVLLAGASTAVRAEDGQNYGVARISDRPAPIPETGAAPYAENCGYGESCDGCDNGLHPSYSPLHFFLTNRGGASHSPDHGWRRPVKTPIRRVPVEYKRFWPTKWYGEPGSGLAAGYRAYPMVYTPTDTTQLGYYYQRVPQWQPNPAMLPPKPWPAHWHRRELVNPCCGDDQCGCEGNAGYGYGSRIPNGTVAPASPAPADDNTDSAPPPPVPDDELDRSASSIWDLKTVGS